jgi:hypothetical protein
MPKPFLPKLSADNPLAKLPTYLHVSDIQGLSQLATQGVLGVTGLAETVQGSVYKSVAAPFGLLGSRFVDAAPGSSGIRSTGITGLVYGGVRGITRLAGGTVNAVLSRAVPLVRQQKSAPQREAMLAVINGVLGDQLLETANPLAITMSLRENGETLVLEKAALAERLPHATGKVLVMLHGLCMNDLQWTAATAQGPQDHGLLLAQKLGYTPVYLHYNSGLHTSINGQQFSSLLEQLLKVWPHDVTVLTLLCHSMGGLVARSACHHAEQSDAAWRKKLINLIFLGTPHHGAPLERLGNWVDTLLGSNLVTKPFARIGQIRSSGITDLRYGHVLTSSWQGGDRFQRSPDLREPLPLPPADGPAAVNCYTVAATTSEKPGDLKDHFFGDGLVPVRSALGLHSEPRHILAFAPDKQWVASGVGHIALLRHAEVSTRLLHWLGRQGSSLNL